MLEFDIQKAQEQVEKIKIPGPKDPNSEVNEFTNPDPRRRFIEMIATEVSFLNVLYFLDKKIGLNNRHIQACLKAYSKIKPDEIERQGYLSKENFENLLDLAEQLREKHLAFYQQLLTADLQSITSGLEELSQLYIDYATAFGNGKLPPAVIKASSNFNYEQTKANTAQSQIPSIPLISTILIAPVQRPPRYMLLAKQMLDDIKKVDKQNDPIYAKVNSLFEKAEYLAGTIESGKASNEKQIEQNKLLKYAEQLAHAPTIQNIQTFMMFTSKAPFGLFEHNIIQTAMDKLKSLDTTKIDKKALPHFLNAIQKIHSQLKLYDMVIKSANETLSELNDLNPKADQIRKDKVKTIEDNKQLKEIKTEIVQILTDKVSKELIQEANKKIIHEVQKVLRERQENAVKDKKESNKQLNSETVVFYGILLNKCKAQTQENPDAPINFELALQESQLALMELRISSDVFVSSDGFAPEFNKLVHKIVDVIYLNLNALDLNKTFKITEGYKEIASRETMAENKTLLDVLKAAIQARIRRVGDKGLTHDANYKMLLNFLHFCELQVNQKPWKRIDFTDALLEAYKLDKQSFNSALGIETDKIDLKSNFAKIAKEMGMKKKTILAIPKTIQEENQKKASIVEAPQKESPQIAELTVDALVSPTTTPNSPSKSLVSKLRENFEPKQSEKAPDTPPVSSFLPPKKEIPAIPPDISFPTFANLETFKTPPSTPPVAPSKSSEAPVPTQRATITTRKLLTDEQLREKMAATRERLETKPSKIKSGPDGK